MRGARLYIGAIAAAHRKSKTKSIRLSTKTWR